MQVNEKREIKRQKKREKILNAAAELFSHNSYHEVMMEDVAKLISVAKGTVYNYFTSKEDLYFSIMKMRMENLISSLKDKIKSEESSIDSLRSFVTHLYMFMMKYQNFFLMYQRESLHKTNKNCAVLVSLDRELKILLRGIINSGEEKNLFRIVDKDLAVNIVLGSVYGSIQRGIDNKLTESGKKTGREKLFEFVLHGLYSGFQKIPQLPLKGKTIVITRTIEQSKESEAKLGSLGASVIIFPTLEILPPSSWDEFDRIVAHPNKIDFIVFTSTHSVEMFIERCNELGIELNFNKTKVVAIGSKTTSLCRKNNIPVQIIPQKFSAEGVVEELSKFNLKNRMVFIPRSAIGREELPRGLKELGAKIKPVPVYNVSLPSRNTIQKNIAELKESNPDLFIFTSPSTFENYLKIQKISDPGNYFINYSVAAIGPTTKAAIEKAKVKVNIMPDEYTIDALINKITDFYNDKTVEK